MGIFDKVIAKAFSRQVDNMLRTVATNINRNIAIYPSYDINSYGETYAANDDVYSIIRLLFTTSAMIPIYAYEVKDEKKHRKIKKIKQLHLKQKELYQLKDALEDLPDTDRVAALLARPNDYQSETEFKEAVYFWMYTAGEAFIYKERPDAGVNRGFTTAMHVLHPANVTLKVTDTLPRKVVFYDYKVNGIVIYENMPTEDMIHLKYMNPLMDYSGSELRGLSPLKVLSKRLTRMDANLDVSVAQMQNGGVETIVFDKAPMDEAAAGVAGARKENFYRFLKNPSNAGAPFFATGEMGALHIGSTIADLKALEISQADFKKLCNAYGISDRLLNNDATGSEVSDDNARKGLYTTGCLPTVYKFQDGLKLHLLEEFEKGVTITEYDDYDEVQITNIKGDGKKRDLQADISEIPELQDDYAQLAATFAAMPVMIPNDVLEAFKYDRSTDPLMEKPYIKTGYTAIDDMQPISDIPLVTPEGN